MLTHLSLSAATASPTAMTLEADRARHRVVLTAHAEGAQIYQCQARVCGALLWSFREPIAALIIAGKTIGRHYAGPHWALEDGSLVQGKVVTAAPGATSADIPQLKLAVIANTGRRALSPAVLVYCMNTHGGTLAGACEAAGMLQTVAYSADYVFAK